MFGKKNGLDKEMQKAESETISSIIDKSMSVTGELTFKGKTRIDGSVEGNIVDYVARQSQAEGREGDIIRFADGHMVKIKNDWYVRIHKALDRVRFDRNIVNLIINEEIDDVIPMMPVDVVRRVRQFETDFWNAFSLTQDRLAIFDTTSALVYGDDRKRIALEFIPTLERKEDAQFIFRMLDGHDLRKLMLDHIEKCISSNKKWDACAEWMGMNEVV